MQRVEGRCSGLPTACFRLLVSLLISASQDAEEYAELPVRHNEDQLNSQLALQLPLQVNPHSYDSAHTKTHLLLQAHFSHAQLPCSDYTTDTKTVLDNAIRICQVGFNTKAVDQNDLFQEVLYSIIKVRDICMWLQSTNSLQVQHCGRKDFTPIFTELV